MKIALIGYGKMGRAIEEDALQNGHEIVLKIGSQNLKELTIENLRKADVAIEFTTPSTVLNHIYLCFDAGIPLVVGTTGWYDKMNLIRADLECREAALFYASNFSIGVNIFFQMNEVLAEVMNDFEDYEPSIEEVHHTQKIDSPSGTAITLAEGMLSFLETKEKWKNILEKRKPEHSGGKELLIYSEREGDVKGIHTVRYRSENDQLVFTHEAFNRKGFAQGAVLAAEWVLDKRGLYNMRDLLGFISEPK